MILDKTFPPDPRVENEAISLINNGFEVYLFCLTYGNQKKEEIINGINIKRYTSNKLIYKSSALVYTIPFYSYIMAKKIKRFLDKNKIQAIHIHDMQIAEAVFKANKKFNLPTVLDLHDNMPEVIKFYPHLQKFPGKQLISPFKWKKKEEEFIKKATKICTVSQEFIDEVIQRTSISKNKIVLVPNTVQKEFYTNAKINNSILNKYKDNFVILYLGDTAIRRGLLTAIKAMPQLIKKIPNVKLVIVGSNTTDYILFDEVTKLKLDDYVDFEGWQNVALFSSYIKASTICISPLYRNKQHDVAYANKLFQYMSFGKPLLVSNAIAQKKLIKKVNSGLVHKEKDISDFAEKVLKLYENKNLRKELGIKGKQFIENEFNWEKTSEKLIDLYKNIN
ncbi:glycosyltransferase family 4 protein [Lutibacter sp.]|uniref:glycosyltransferase family 4 protein n=1 Tax=Lutibacter sp. TaxID=1925666 RepID=UPI0025B96FBD|nr:glycosyltransferase family 4 protein [Lutibacter sp.]MCF6181008.1 glycosyltransferase family 4 protein [Lutibacter sp.]